ncbi:MAG TPA: GNAT family N-acetyltransferase [Streptosporangiaceae bacterium]|jgi:ribosomal protein S18 acetylase RimI-like enzyme
MTLTGGSGGFESPWTSAGERRIRADAQLLQTALRKAVSTSPEAFFTTLADLKARSDAGWVREIRTSSWAVLEAGDAVVGIAAAKPPDPVADSGHDPARACFIESVWVDPGHRRQGLGERLVRYLIETQRGRGIEWFLLWVLPANLGAISFYESLGFRKTGELKPYTRDDQGSWGLEVQFGRQFGRPDAGGGSRAARPRRPAPRRGTAGNPVGCRLLGAALDAEP